MKIGIYPDQIGKESYSEQWTRFLSGWGVEVETIDLLSLDVLDQARKFDGIMCRYGHNPQHKQSLQKILYTIEHHLKIPVYPNSATAWHYDEKKYQYYLLNSIHAPLVKTWLFWEKEQASEWTKSAAYPMVFKLSTGAGSSDVLLLRSQREVEQYIHKMFDQGLFPYTLNEYRNNQQFSLSKSSLRNLIKRIYYSIRYVWNGNYPPLNHDWWQPEFGYIYFQEFLPENAFDTRISVIGNRAFGFRRMNRPGDFRASGSGMIDHNPAEIDPRCIQIAFEISQKFCFQCMSYDFLYKEDQPLIAEISYAFADWAVEACPGHWDPSLNWIEGRMWPEEAQAEDFIRYIQNHTSGK